MKNIIPPILVLIIFLLVWTLGASLYNMPFLLPNPLEVAQAFVTDLTWLLVDFGLLFKKHYMDIF